jgi:hypothetical protein
MGQSITGSVKGVIERNILRPGHTEDRPNTFRFQALKQQIAAGQ